VPKGVVVPPMRLVVPNGDAMGTGADWTGMAGSYHGGMGVVSHAGARDGGTRSGSALDPAPDPEPEAEPEAKAAAAAAAAAGSSAAEAAAAPGPRPAHGPVEPARDGRRPSPLQAMAARW
jgi:hypothetical protein